MHLLVLTAFLAFACCDADQECPIIACPDLYHEVGDQCFYISMGDECWSTARQNCLDMGADLAAPHDVDALKAFAFTYTNRRAVWIGGTDSASEGNWWTYINGDPIQSSDWYADQPSNSLGNQDCLEIRNSLSPPLNDYDCFYSQPFVCEVPRTPNIPTCTPSATLIGDECFTVVTTAEDWDTARGNCQAKGGDLATPCDVDAFYTWASVISGGNGVWLGANDRVQEGFWEWLNRDPIYSRDWAGGEPNNSGGSEDCAIVNNPSNPQLNDLDCSASRDYACEFDPIYV